MRTLILTMLLATVATPALADPGDREGRRDRDGSSEQARPERHTPRGQGQAPAQVRVQAPPPVRVEVNRGAPQGGPPNQIRFDRSRGNQNNGVVFQGRPARPQGGPVAVQGQPYRGDPRVDRRDPRNGNGFVRQDGGQAQGVARYPNGAPVDANGDGRPDNNRGLQWGNQNRDGRYQGDRNRDGRYQGDRNSSGLRWSNAWRNDRRYDWRDYRNRNRQVFRVGRYYDPFGYGYQRLSIGFTLFSGYYQSNYWLDNPYQYRLPPVYGPYRWVRYYDDAVLVDIYTGEVVDVIQGFFW